MKILILVISLILCSVALSHGGRTNAKGCHNDRKNGGYHCHNSGKKAKPRIKKASKPIARSLLGKSQGKFTCSGKTVCKQMVSCDEAKFYLKECKLYRLDRDDDGIPCENICGG